MVSLSLFQLIHSTVIDTSIVFPHRIGLPYKRALRNLMADHLKRIIQDNGETGTGQSLLVIRALVRAYWLSWPNPLSL